MMFQLFGLLNTNIKLVLKKIDFKIWKLRIKLRYVKNRTYGDVDEILWVNPESIKKVGIGWGNYNRLDEMGKVKGGDWDLNTMDFEDLDAYQSLKDRFVGNRKWEDLSYIKGINEKILNGEILWGLKSSGDLKNRLKNLDLLYFNIKNNGYHSQQEILNSAHSKKRFDEITVRIARNGELLFENGRHRLSIAKILGLTRIPVIVTWRHKEWNKFSFFINNYNKKNHFKNSDRKMVHPEFESILQKDDRYELIKNSLDFNGGTLLDLGANLGYFSHQFENIGFKCFAIEGNKEKFDLLNKIRIIEKKEFTAINTEIFSFDEKSNFDVVLALNVFHKGLKTSKSLRKMEIYLNRLQVKIIFFEPNSIVDIKHENIYRSFDHLEFVKFICKNTSLREWKLIGKSTKGNPIYKIY